MPHVAIGRQVLDVVQLDNVHRDHHSYLKILKESKGVATWPRVAATSSASVARPGLAGRWPENRCSGDWVARWFANTAWYAGIRPPDRAAGRRAQNCRGSS